MSLSDTAASPNCAYHPDRPAAGSCSECQQQACFGCQMTVAGKTVCQPCVAAIRSRLANQMNPAGVGTSATPQAPLYGSAGGDAAAIGGGYGYQPAASTVAEVDDFDSAVTPMGMVGGIGVGLIAAVGCAFLYEKFIFLTHFNISYIAIGVGFVIGLAVCLGSRRGGFVPGLMAGGLTLFSILLTRFMLVNDVVSREVGHTVFLPLNGETMGMALESVSIFGWIITAIGVAAGFGTANRAGGGLED